MTVDRTPVRCYAGPESSGTGERSNAPGPVAETPGGPDLPHDTHQPVREHAAAAAGLLRHLKDPTDDAPTILWGIRRHLDRIEAELELTRPF